jgi:methyltransferase (TIGR00027 family)
MRDDRPSATAFLIARSAYYLSRDPVLGDFIPARAAELYGWFVRAGRRFGRGFDRVINSKGLRPLSSVLERATVPGIKLHYALRKRYLEEVVRGALAGGIRQVVVIGAGFDTLALRLAEEFAATKFFEVDHPATQEWKRRVLPAAGEAVFVPVDLAADSLGDGLRRAGFDAGRPAFVGWLGVTMYLTIEAIESTCRLVAQCAPGTELALSYAVAAGHMDADSERLSERFGSLAEGSCEPIVSRLSPADAEALLRRCGLRVIDHPRHEELRVRYFGGRADGLQPGAAERVLAARTD